MEEYPIICDVVENQVDNERVKAISAAISSLLGLLPITRTRRKITAVPSRVKTLRKEIAVSIERLHLLAEELDPIRHPDWIFDPSNPKFLGELIGKTMIEQPPHSLGELDRFYGSGVYAIYYSGDYHAYQPLRGKKSPIYVGKADPSSPEAKTHVEQGTKLATRLAEHAKSIRAAKGTLKIEDFTCRYLVVQSGWQKAAEDYLVNLFAPIWNQKICYGFGKHGDDPGTRKNTRSPWDTLHPGRPWATRGGNKPNSSSVTEIVGRIEQHFADHPPKH